MCKLLSPIRPASCMGVPNDPVFNAKEHKNRNNNPGQFQQCARTSKIDRKFVTGNNPDNKDIDIADEKANIPRPNSVRTSPFEDQVEEKLEQRGAKNEVHK